jgi:phage tail sheath protein FI
MSRENKTSFIPGETQLLGGSPEKTGPKLWGDRTITVDRDAQERTLERLMRNDLVDIVDQFEGVPNEAWSRNQITQMVHTYMQGIRARRELGGYRVVCDERNNTDEVIDRGDIAARVDYQRVGEMTWRNLIS